MIMKKTILVLTLSAFSIAAFAGGPCCGGDKGKTACADKAKVAGATCQDGKAACCEKSKDAKKVQSPKAAAAEAGR
jgi:hypothetical protein